MRRRNRSGIVVFEGRFMRRLPLIAVLLLAGALVAPPGAAAWVRGGLGIVYGGPYVAFGAPCPPPVVYAPPVYYPPPVMAYWPTPVLVAPPASWPSYGVDVAVRWNRYFTPDGPRVQGYTLPR